MYMNRKTDTCIVTYVLIGLNAAAFLLSEVMGGSQDQGVMLKLGAAYTPYILDGQVWRLFTSMFLHFGITHLTSNMIVLAALGENHEKMLGHLRFLLLYLVGGLFGNVCSVIADVAGGSESVSAGASGAVFALLGAIVILYLYRRDIFRIPVTRVIFGLALALLPGFDTEGIDLVAHVGGLVAGAILMLPMSRRI